MATLLETHLRAEITAVLADSFDRVGHKTEARLLKTQANKVVHLVKKAMDEMPAVDPWEMVRSALSGTMTTDFRAARKNRGKHFKDIADAEKIMLKTLKRAFNNYYKSHPDWNRREQIKARDRMINALMLQPRLYAKRLSAEAKGGPKS